MSLLSICFLIHKVRLGLVFPQLNWVDSSLLGIETSVYEIIHKPFFFEKLLVVKEVGARKDSLKEPSSFELFIGLD